jgi:hypothetical protein
MKDVKVDNYPYVVFGMPQAVKRTFDGVTIKRLRVPIKKLTGTKEFMGYLPLPKRYMGHWKQLCYHIIYHKEMHQALRRVGKGYPNIRKALHSLSSILKYNLFCQGLIIEEILGQKGSRNMELPTFDEYIIKERFNLHWTPILSIPMGDKEPGSYLGWSPFDEDI